MDVRSKNMRPYCRQASFGNMGSGFSRAISNAMRHSTRRAFTPKPGENFAAKLRKILTEANEHAPGTGTKFASLLYENIPEGKFKKILNMVRTSLNRTLH